MEDRRAAPFFDMDEHRIQHNAITEGSILKQLMNFFFPVLLGMLFQQLYNMADAVIVGRFVGKNALAAVGGSASQILNLIIGFFTGLCSGATVIIAQYFGANDDEDVGKGVQTAIVFAAVCGVIMTVVGITTAPWLLRLMDTPEETMADSVSYMRIVYMAMIPAMIYNMGSAILRAVGDSKRPLYFLIICCVLNVAMDIAAVVVFELAVEGVAIATSLAQLISAVLVCRSLMRSKQSYRLELKDLLVEGRMMRRAVHIGLPAGLQSVLYAISNMIITASINKFGTDTVAAWVAVNKLDAFNWMVMNAYSISLMTFVGQNYGAGLYDRARTSLRDCMALGIITTSFISVLFMLTCRFFFGLFVEDESVMVIAVQILGFMAPWYWTYAPIEIFGGGLRGLGDTLIPTIITAAGICLTRVIWIYTAVPRWHSISTVALSYPLTWGLTAAAFVIYYFCFVRKRLMRGSNEK